MALTCAHHTPVRGCSSTLDTGSPAYSPCSRTTSSVRLGLGFSQPVGRRLSGSLTPPAHLQPWAHRLPSTW